MALEVEIETTTTLVMNTPGDRNLIKDALNYYKDSDVPNQSQKDALGAAAATINTAVGE